MQYYLKTLGCQMNKNDSERVASVVEDLGYTEVGSQNDADLIIVNTCSIRQSAEDRVFGQQRNWEDLKKKNPKLSIAVTGCLPGRDKSGDLRKKLPVVDFFFPIKDLPQLPSWLAGRYPEIAMSGDLETDYLKIRPKIANAKQAWVTIMSGCNNYCTFCVVPYSRGFERSRDIKDVLDEVKKLVDSGTLEITLLGQNVNTYRPNDAEVLHKENPYADPFAALLWEMNKLDGLERIHFTSPNPQDMSDEVIDALALPKHMNLLHLPIQSGSERILKKMNRKHTRKEYFEIIDKVNKKVPGIALATDIIVGFCSETEKEFLETVDLYKKVKFDISYNAIYSPRSGTVAGRLWEDDVTEEEKKKRWEHLHNVMCDITLEKNQAYKERESSVMVEKFDKGFLWGHSSELKLVRFKGEPELIGSIQPVRIKDAQTWQLVGELQQKN